MTDNKQPKNQAQCEGEQAQASAIEQPMNENGYTEQMLADGSTLVYLKHRFMEKKTKEQLDWIYACIRDSKLIVPLIPISRKPDMLEDDEGTRYLAIFSQEAQMPEDYRDEFILEPMTFEACLELARSIPEIDSMALDGFTETMVIDFPLAEVILQTPSRLHKE